MKESVYKTAVLGVITGVLGLIISLIPFGHNLEEHLGLGMLFGLRGARNAPPGVVIISIDKASSDVFQVPAAPGEWPRALHARLIDRLAGEGPALIAFDVNFAKEQSREDDARLAAAIERAGNVILFEYLRREIVPLEGVNASPNGSVNIESVVPPMPLFTRQAAATAPFPLPKVPVRVNQFWTFKTSAGDRPTLPVVAFQVYAREEYGAFRQLLERAGSLESYGIPSRPLDSDAPGTVVDSMQRIREKFLRDPGIGDRMLMVLERDQAFAGRERTKTLLTSLINMYRTPDSQYLNFYGPPHTITTVSYHEAMSLQESQLDAGAVPDMRGKAVFVGLSDNRQTEQKDGFYTVFSQPNGVDLSGVEIAATAFANLLEDAPVRPLRRPAQAAIMVFFGLASAVVCRSFRPLIAGMAVAGMSGGYLLLAVAVFSSGGTWYPLAVPFLVQVPLAYLGAVLWTYHDFRRERESIRKALLNYMPGDMVDRLTRNFGDIRSGSRVVYGVCLCTDLDRYTKLSEEMHPGDLGDFINDYYHAVMVPVRRHGGAVSNIVADSMLAIWASVECEADERTRACCAALEIAAAVRAFNDRSETVKLSTRIGLNCGHFFLGTIGTLDHYEYRPLGDIVNSAARIEGLNKYLGTGVLAAGEVIDQVDAFLTRELGTFLLYGKSQPITVHELMGLRERATQRQRDLCAAFAHALGLFRRRSWREAAEAFAAIGDRFGDDGPSAYYHERAQHFAVEPPGEEWDGMLRMEKK